MLRETTPLKSGKPHWEREADCLLQEGKIKATKTSSVLNIFLWNMEFVLLLNKEPFNFLLMSDTFTLHWLLQSKSWPFLELFLRALTMVLSTRWLGSGGSIMQISAYIFSSCMDFSSIRDSRNLCRIIMGAKAGIRMWIILLFGMKKEYFALDWRAGKLFDQDKTTLGLQIVRSPPGQQTIPFWQLQVGVTSSTFLQYVGDVLSHLELSFARHIEHPGWDPIKHLDTGLSSTGLPRCLT